MKNITIFIHGTFPHNLFPNPFSVLSEKILHNYFHCPPGLNKATALDKDLHIRAMAETMSQSDPHQFPLDDFYTFGWPGELDFEQREKAAQDLCIALNKLTKQYGEKPHITIITHSHGGNVALNLGKLDDRILRQAQDDRVSKHQDIRVLKDQNYQSNNISQLNSIEASNNQKKQINNKTVRPELVEGFEQNILVDQLILLACPVQEQTADYIKSPLFKNIYSIHSHSDILQVGDPQGWQRLVESLGDAWQEKSFAPLTSTQLTPFFSERHFQPHKKLTQAQLTLEGRNPFHFEFLYLDFMHALPRILTTIQAYTKQTNYTPEQEIVLEFTEQ